MGLWILKKSDHNLLYIEQRKSWKSVFKNKREEIFNFNDQEGFKRFVQETSTNDALKHCFDDESEDVEVSSKRWLKILNNIIKTSFRTIRIRKQENK